MEKIVIKGIGKRFEGKRVLDDIELTIEPGSFFTLLGPSGCGKTTLLRILAGFEKPDDGNVYFGEREMTQIPAESRGVGMVFQNYALFPHLDVYENVAYGLKLKKLPKKAIQQSVTQYLQLVRLSGYEKRKISELSGGEQQRVALARVLVTQPEVLLLDEPLCNLDAKLRDEMREEIKSLQRQLGITTIFVTHDQKEALMMSDQIAVLHEGRCVQVGSPVTIYHQPKSIFVATFLGEMNVLSADQVSQLRLENLVRDQGEWLGIRPEHVEIHTHHQKGENQWEGLVKNIQFNGPMTEYLLDVQGIPFKSIQMSHVGLESDRTIGQVVGVHLPKVAQQVLGV